MAMKRKTTAYVAMNSRFCMACWECVEKCPKNVIGKTGLFLHRHVVFKNADACVGCGKCIKNCPHGVFFKLNKTVSAQSKNKGILFSIERLLPTVFLLSVITGIGLHIAGNCTSHEVWHNWVVAHILASFFWLLLVAVHVKRHSSWFKTLLSKEFVNKRWINFLLLVLFLIVAVTGILLIASVKSAHSSIGLLHYKLGLLLLIVSLIHIFYRK